MIFIFVFIYMLKIIWDYLYDTFQPKLIIMQKNNNYLKEDIVNKKGESCMEYSYVYVYMNDYNSYTYKPYIYCGSETPNNTTTLDSPVITDFNFSNSSKVKKASFSMKIKGSNSDSTIKIDSYNYTIYVKKTGVLN